MHKSLKFLFVAAAALIFAGAGCISFGGTTVAGPAGMFRSADKGNAWHQIVSLPTAQGIKSLANVNVYRVTPDPGDINTLYLSTRGQGLFYTYNNGESWQSVDDAALRGQFIYALAVDPKNKCILYASEGTHIYKSIDCSRTWQTIYNEERPSQHFVSLAIDYGDSRIVYGALSGGDILASVDSGTSWQVIKRFGFDLQNLVTDPLDPGRVYVASYANGLYRSDDRGASWTDLSGGIKNFSNGLQFYRFILHPGKKDSIFWLSKYGILRSDDAGANWTDLKLITPPGAVNIYAFAVNPKNEKEMYYTGTILGEKNVPVRSTFYKTVDGGETWVTKKLPSNAIPVYLWVHPVQSDALFLGYMNP